MFTKQQIEEIALKLKSVSKKDSDFEKTNEVNDTDELAILKDRQNRKLSLRGLVNYLNGRIGKPVNYYKITVKTDPTDAKVVIGDIEGNVASFIEGSNVTIVVSKEGYKTETRSVILDSDKELTIKLTAVSLKTKVTVESNPSDATIYINGYERSYAEVDRGSFFTVYITKEGYEEYRETFEAKSETMYISKTLTPVESDTATLVITSTIPANAVVKLNGELTRAITVRKGTSVHWECYKEGYISREGDIVVNSYTELSITLQAISTHIFKLYPISPIDETNIIVTINGEETIINSSSETNYAEYQFDSINNTIEYRVEKEGYISQSQTLQNLTEDTTIPIELQRTAPEIKVYTISFDITPVDATVLLDGVEYDISTPYQGYEGDTIRLDVSKSGYISKTVYHTIVGDATITVSLNYDSAALRLVPVDENFNPLNVESTGTTQYFKLMLNDNEVTSNRASISVSQHPNNIAYSFTFDDSLEKLKFSIGENTTTDSITWKLYASYQVPDTRQFLETEYTIIQSGTGVEYYIRTNNKTINFSSTGGVQNITISSNIEWEIE